MSSLNGNKTNSFGDQETMLVKTVKGREIEADLVVCVLRQVFVKLFVDWFICLLHASLNAQLLCTGQKPNTSLLHNMDSGTIDPKSGMVRVSRTMQILTLRWKDTTLDECTLGICSTAETSPTLCGTVPPSPVDTLAELDFALPAPMSPSACTHEMFVESEADASYDPHTFVYPHLFAIGDAADAFGACKAGHTAYYQGEVAARNVIKLIKGNAGTPAPIFWGLTLVPGEGEREHGSLGAEEGSEGDLELEEYVPGFPMIKVSLGLVSISSRSFVKFIDPLDRRDRRTKWPASWGRKTTGPMISELRPCGGHMGTGTLTTRECGGDSVCWMLNMGFLYHVWRGSAVRKQVVCRTGVVPSSS